ncbi:MAG TPA: hypothetical protein VGI81_25560, partial [Tepidisphaeraceae bacterium]
YSSVSVKSVEVGVLAAAHRGQACVLGIDVAKFELMAVPRWPDGTFGRPWRIANPGDERVVKLQLDLQEKRALRNAEVKLANHVLKKARIPRRERREALAGRASPPVYGGSAGGDRGGGAEEGARGGSRCDEQPETGRRAARGHCRSGARG